jgi:hypothetical protein
VTFTAVANDIDLPSQSVLFSLAPGAPEGATINGTNGLFNWRPNDFQGGQDYRIGIIARDDGSPIMSSTQTFNVTVRDTRSDVIVAVGTTNVLAGGTIAVPITLTSGGDLSHFTFELSANDPHITSIQLNPAGDEVLSSVLESLEPGRYRVRIELDPVLVRSGTRSVGTLQFSTKVNGKSSIASLTATALNATRQNGENIANTSVGSGRIFAIENEPLMDTAFVAPDRVRLVFYATPGTQLIMEDSSNLRNANNWVESTGLTMSTTYHIMHVPTSAGSPAFFRLKRVN